MPLTKEQKQKVVEDLKEKIDKQKSMVFVAVEGLKAKELFDLRKKLKAEDCLLIVVKKTLLDIVFKEKKLDFAPKKLEGQVALVFGFKDELSPAKIVYQFSLGNKNLKILAGFFEDKFRDVEETITLAKIPGKEELLARIVGSISAPVSNFVNVLQAPLEACILTIKSLGVNKIDK